MKIRLINAAISLVLYLVFWLGTTVGGWPHSLPRKLTHSSVTIKIFGDFWMMMTAKSFLCSISTAMSMWKMKISKVSQLCIRTIANPSFQLCYILSPHDVFPLLHLKKDHLKNKLLNLIYHLL